MQKLLKEKYKTFANAAKRAAFERSLAPFEFRQGYKAKLYQYRIISVDGFWRVERSVAENKPVQA